MVWTFTFQVRAVSLVCLVAVIIGGCKQRVDVVSVHSQFMDTKETWMESDGTPMIKVVQLDSKGVLSQQNIAADKDVLISWCTWVGQIYYIGSDGFLYLLNRNRAKDKRPDHPGARPINVGIRSSKDIISVCDDDWPLSTPFYFLTKDGILVSVRNGAGGTSLSQFDTKCNRLTRENTRVSWGRTGEGTFSDISLIIDCDGKKSGFRLKGSQFADYHHD